MVRKVFEGANALLSAAGLPPQFWPYAIRDYCFAENIKMIDGDSAWNKRFKKGHFKGPVIPFGCLVDFKQTPDMADRMPKAAPDAVPGIMFGYKLNPGGHFEGRVLLRRPARIRRHGFLVVGLCPRCVSSNRQGSLMG